MNFAGRKRRRPPSVIIVSLIDVLLVVLIFLMVTTAFKDTPAFKLTLPETSQKAPQSGVNDNPPLIVTITTNAPNFYLGKVAVTLDRLKAELTQRAKENPRLIVAIRADDQAAYGNVVKVTEAAQAAQVSEVRTFLKPGIKPE
ncbi:MAG TPA: biopolymer transporter ExbD [Candidatus Limnocylindria bacterium]|nr:biopolymer transporter ExbD [Candidatus Limnocylindria bacterium]